jgi:hypothetical protein
MPRDDIAKGRGKNMADGLVTEVTAESVGDLLREIGWKSTSTGTKAAPQLVGTVEGVNFNVRFAARALGKGGWTDFTLSAPFTVDQAVSPVIGAFWNRRNRFARAYRTDAQLFLDMDVTVAGGVSRAHIKYQFAVWSDLTRMFVQHLRADHAVLGHYSASGSYIASRSTDRANFQEAHGFTKSTKSHAGSLSGSGSTAAGSVGGSAAWLAEASNPVERF